MKLVHSLMWGVAGVLGIYFIVATLDSPRPKRQTPTSMNVVPTASVVQAPELESRELRERSTLDRSKSKGTVRGDATSKAAPAESPVLLLLNDRFGSAAKATSEARGREVTISKLFDTPELKALATLESFECRQDICRGVLDVSESGEGDAMNLSFLSSEFARAIPAAITVPSREVLPNGRIKSTFFIHRDSDLVDIPAFDDDEVNL